ncbi:MAG: hypothetical protein HRU46_09060, partial [Verrucomicrobiales bacterium]|nr:hypothetical protein [Verrucomicrobiales bacterium]
MIFKRLSPTWFLVIPVIGALAIAALQDTSAQKEEQTEKASSKKKKGKKAPQITITAPFTELNQPDRQEDFPAMCINEEGKPIVVFIDHSDGADSLKVAELLNGKLKPVATVSAEDVTNITQPCLTMMPGGRHLC